MKGSDSMSNPLYNLYTGSNGGGSIQNFISEFKKFRDTFVGDPRETINTLLSQGKITREQLDKATKIANQLKGLI